MTAGKTHGDSQIHVVDWILSGEETKNFPVNTNTRGLSAGQDESLQYSGFEMVEIRQSIPVQGRTTTLAGINIRAHWLVRSISTTTTQSSY